MKEIRRILKEETAIPENIDKAMEDVLSKGAKLELDVASSCGIKVLFE